MHQNAVGHLACLLKCLSSVLSGVSAGPRTLQSCGCTSQISGRLLRALAAPYTPHLRLTKGSDCACSACPPGETPLIPVTTMLVTYLFRCQCPKLCPLEIISTEEHSYDVAALLAGSSSILMTALSLKLLNCRAAPRRLHLLLPVLHCFWATMILMTAVLPRCVQVFIP